jgi:hypothetical protein
VVAGTVLLSVAAGAGWAVTSPRPLLVITGPGAAGLVKPETSAFIAADGSYCLMCLAGGLVSGVLGYVLAVRRHGPLAMAAVVVGAVAAGYVTRWVGEQSGLASFQHLLASLPAGRRLRGSLNLGSSGALAFWPLAASAAAGALTAISKPAGRHSVRDAGGPAPGSPAPEGPHPGSAAPEGPPPG